MTFKADQPEYEALRDLISEKTSPFTFWIGAGLSKQAGTPTWIELADTLTHSLRRKADSLEDESEKGRLRALADSVSPPHADMWSEMGRLREGLGKEVFRSEVSRALGHTETCPIPAIFEKIWELSPTGVVSLNLDFLCHRAYQKLNGDKVLIKFTGWEAGEQGSNALKSPRSFLAQVHGDLDDPGSWVVDQTQLSALLRKKSYSAWIGALLQSTTVIFIGVTADDVAIRSHLESFRDAGVDFRGHYWITSHTSLATDIWGNEHGLQVIRYSAPESDHSSLETILDDLLSYQPSDKDASLVLAESVSDESKPLPEPSELLRVESANEIRFLLNQHAKAIFANRSNSTVYADFKVFVKKYGQAVHRAWWVDVEPPDNELLDYRIVREIGSGAFGQVFEAESPDGTAVAIKLLRQDVRRIDEMLQSFRRGVRSMNILTRENIPGVAKYIDASEIPTFVVMELIDGQNLREVVESGQISGWDDVLFVAHSIAEAIDSAHGLSERVLHRDIRPSNVMIEHVYLGVSRWRVVVLDFDLSWHEEAIEKSVDQSKMASGYLAPEQIDPNTGMSTRRSTVDSYGLGMTLFFLSTGQEPLSHRVWTESWETTLKERICSQRCATFRSLPTRYARLIRHATEYNQTQRWTVSQMLRELKRLREALSDFSFVTSAEIAAEELAFRVSGKKGYSWDPDKLVAHVNLPSGLEIQIEGHESSSVVKLRASWESRGMDSRKNITKYLGDAVNKGLARLRRGGWEADADRPSHAAFLQAEIPVSAVTPNIAAVADQIDGLRTDFSFS